MPQPIKRVAGKKLGWKPRPIPSSIEVRVSREKKLLRIVERGTNRTVADFPIAIGEAKSPTPKGNFRIDHINTNPFYRKRDGTIVPAGPDNPLFPALIVLQRHNKRISQSIHGTEALDSIGKEKSAGCVRMKRDDIAQLSRLLKPGMRIKIR